MGTAVSNDIRVESLRALAERAGALANLQPENRNSRDCRGPAQLESMLAFDREAALCTPSLRADGVGVACRRAASLGYTAAGSMSTGSSTLSVANSKGVFAEFETTIADASTVIMNGTASGWSHVSGWKLDAVDWETISKRSSGESSNWAKCCRCRPGEMTVVLDPFATADLLGMLAFDGISGLSFQEGRSWMNGRAGQKIMSPR